MSNIAIDIVGIIFSTAAELARRSKRPRGARLVREPEVEAEMSHGNGERKRRDAFAHNLTIATLGPYKHVGYGDLPAFTVQCFWINQVETCVDAITPNSWRQMLGSLSLSLFHSLSRSLLFLTCPLINVSNNTLLLNCAKQ